MSNEKINLDELEQLYAEWRDDRGYNVRGRLDNRLHDAAPALLRLARAVLEQQAISDEVKKILIDGNDLPQEKEEALTKAREVLREAAAVFEVEKK